MIEISARQLTRITKIFKFHTIRNSCFKNLRHQERKDKNRHRYNVYVYNKFYFVSLFNKIYFICWHVKQDLYYNVILHHNLTIKLHHLRIE